MSADRALEVVETGPLTTVQDLGRFGHAALGVGSSGAADRTSFRLANRLVGNPETAAALEVTFGGLAVRAHGNLTVALTGAPCPVTVDARVVACHTTVSLPDGAELRLGPPSVGLRTYLAVAGGIAVDPVLGSRATDVTAGVGVEVPRPGTVLPVGPASGSWPAVDVAPVPELPADEVVLRVRPGPRDDWFVREAWHLLVGEPYEVTSESDRVGMRLAGPVLERARDGELPSEGMVRGSLQVPPTGQPVLFLADHPVTGGYPVIAVVVDADVDRAAQARPGQHLRFRPAR